MEKTELEAFIEQMFYNWERVGTGFKGSYLEKPLTENLSSFYPQFKFIFEELDKSIFLDKQDLSKTAISHRKGEILRKLLFRKEFKEGKVKEIAFLLGETKQELRADEFFDIILSSVASMIEHYIFLIKKQNRFNLSLLAKKLGFDSEFIKHISNKENIEKLFEKLSEETNKKYNLQTKPIFSMMEYKIRCSCFHSDYSYLNEQGEAKIVLDGGKEKINLADFMKTALNLMAKLNIIVVVPYFFFKGILPLKGFKKLI